MDAAAAHGAEIRRCLENLDVAGMLRIWKHVAPHLCNQGPAQALISMHMARVEMKTLGRKLKAYSRDWLLERGYQLIDGKWVEGAPPPTVYSNAVGIAVRSNMPEVGRRIHGAMVDALENELAKGTMEPEKQREAMLKARAKERFKMRLA